MVKGIIMILIGLGIMFSSFFMGFDSTNFLDFRVIMGITTVGAGVVAMGISSIIKRVNYDLEYGIIPSRGGIGRGRSARKVINTEEEEHFIYWNLFLKRK